MTEHQEQSEQGGHTSSVEYWQSRILTAVSDKRRTRDHVAALYAHAITASRYGGNGTFGAVNRAIINRWSESALEYIKRKAWKWTDKKPAL